MITININSVLTKGTYQVKWSAFVTSRSMTHLVPFLSSPPFPFFSSCYQLITLLSCCWVCLYFSSFLFAAIILLLEVPLYFISWNIQVSMICVHTTSKSWGTENFLWFQLNCRNVNGSLGKQEMLWKQEVVSDCFDNFSVFSPTCTSYRNTAFSSRSSFSISWVSFSPDYGIYSHFGAYHLSVSQVSEKRNI